MKGLTRHSGAFEERGRGERRMLTLHQAPPCLPTRLSSDPQGVNVADPSNGTSAEDFMGEGPILGMSRPSREGGGPPGGPGASLWAHQDGHTVGCTPWEASKSCFLPKALGGFGTRFGACGPFWVPGGRPFGVGGPGALGGPSGAHK